MTRICITGGPRTGKTTLAAAIGKELWMAAPVPDIGDCAGPLFRHTDDLIEELKHLGKDSWSEASRRVTEWLDEPGPWIIEGVAVGRALRKWREQNPGKAPPVDRVIYLGDPHVELTPGQAAMAKGVATVHMEIEGWLAAHGVVTERG